MEIDVRRDAELAVEEYRHELEVRYGDIKLDLMETIAANEEFLSIDMPVPLKVLALANQLYEIEKLRMILDPERALETRHWE